MSMTSDRAIFAAVLARELPALGPGQICALASSLTAQAATLYRHAEGQCNGTWPWEDGERDIAQCSRCEAGACPSALRRTLCPDCRTADQVTALVSAYGIVPVFAGDPRGAVLRLRLPAGRYSVVGDELAVPS